MLDKFGRELKEDDIVYVATTAGRSDATLTIGRIERMTPKSIVFWEVDRHLRDREPEYFERDEYVHDPQTGLYGATGNKVKYMSYNPEFRANYTHPDKFIKAV